MSGSDCTWRCSAHRAGAVQQAVTSVGGFALPLQLTSSCQCPAVRPYQDTARVGVAQQSKSRPRQVLHFADPNRGFPQQTARLGTLASCPPVHSPGKWSLRAREAGMGDYTWRADSLRCGHSRKVGCADGVPNAPGALPLVSASSRCCRAGVAMQMTVSTAPSSSVRVCAHWQSTTCHMFSRHTHQSTCVPMKHFGGVQCSHVCYLNLCVQLQSTRERHGDWQ